MSRGQTPYSILVVDDDPAFRALVSAILKTRGYRVKEAGSADEAAAMFSDKETKLAIVDYRMPGKDGVSWIQKLRDAGKAIPVVFVSGNWCDQKTFTWLRNILQVSLIVKKPIVPAVFLEQVESLLPAETRLALQEHGIADIAAHSVMPDDESERGENIRQLMQIRSRLELKSALKVAQASYLQDLGHQWGELVKLCNEIKVSPERIDLQNIAINEAHKIKGTAGSLNLGEVGEIGGKVETLLRVLDPRESTEMEVIWSEINRALAQGERAVHKALDDRSDISQEAHVAVRVLLLGDGYQEILPQLEVATITACSNSTSALGRLKKHTYEACVFDIVHAGRHELFELARQARLPVEGIVPIALIKPDEASSFLSAADELFLGASSVNNRPESQEEMELIVSRLLKVRQAQKQRVVVVDDDMVLLNFVETVLTAHGFNVRTVNNPLETGLMLDQFKPDLLLLDAMMPGMTGYEVCRMVREEEQWQNLPIVFLTGKSSPEARSAAFQAGANDFLSKPVLVDELLSRINGQLAKSAQGKESLAKDANTGLLNEDAFVKAAGELLQATDPRTPMAMALIAADDVEGIRLVHGIEPLRQALVALGGEIRLRFKAEDVRGKIGYDAYALLLKDTTKEVAADAIALLQEEFTSRSFFGDRGNFKLDFSTGITDSTEVGRGIKPLLKQAYQRMLSVRGSASGRIHYAD